MKNWTRPADLRAKLQKLWDRGEFLAGLVSGETGFPRRFPLRGPTSPEMSDAFDEVRAWIAEMKGVSQVRLEMREFTHRVLGANQVPCAAWIDDLDAALALIGRKRDAARFQALVAMTRERFSERPERSEQPEWSKRVEQPEQPERSERPVLPKRGEQPEQPESPNLPKRPNLLEWLAKRPLRALEEAEDWPRLLEVAAWMRAHPRPGIFLRQVDLPGIDTKFLEAHRGLLSELFDALLPAEAVDAAFTAGRFAARYGFRDKPDRIRLRVLDPALSPLSGVARPDLTLDADSFAALELPRGETRLTVFITENETNFLAFPAFAGGIVVFGAGYGWEALSRARWLGGCRIRYWGDIDTHGFAILDQLRGFFPHVESFLMDRETLLAHRVSWVREDKPVLRDLSRLTTAERALYDDLRDNRLGGNIRLEQERVAFGLVEKALSSKGDT